MSTSIIPFPLTPPKPPKLSPAAFAKRNAEAVLRTLADMDYPEMYDDLSVQDYGVGDLSTDEWIERRNWCIQKCHAAARKLDPGPNQSPAEWWNRKTFAECIRHIGDEPQAVNREAMDHLAFRTGAVREWCKWILWAREYFEDPDADEGYPECFRPEEGPDGMALAKARVEG